MTSSTATDERTAAAASPLVADVITALAEIVPGDTRDQARERRPEARDHAQGSFESLFVPRNTAEVSLVERAAVALFVARLHEHEAAVEFYGALLRETGGGPGVEPLIVAEAARAAAQGPYGAFRAENAPESVDGPVYSVESVEAAYALGDRLAAALEHAHMLVLHPRDASREHLEQLLNAGWSTTGIVTLSQIVSFLAFQLRVITGLAYIAGQAEAPERAAATSQRLAALAGEVAKVAAERAGAAAGSPAAASADVAPAAVAYEQLPAAPKVVEPPRFTHESLGWKPWLEPLPAAEFTPLHHEALIQPERIHMPYFRLLARDPDALRERTLTDIDIFFNTDAGLPRAEREIAAAVSSRFTGCVFCASVHAGFGLDQGAEPEVVARILDEGVAGFAAGGGTSGEARSASYGQRWDAIIAATVALTATPNQFGQEEVVALRAAGLDELELLDVVQAGAFFNWANRLMLSLGEPSA